MRCSQPYFLVWGIALISTVSIAQTQSGMSQARYLPFEEAVRLALKDNVDLLAVRDQEEAFKLRAKQALAPNNPVFSLTKVDVPGFSLTQEPAQTVYQLNWTLGFPGKSLLQSASIRHQAEGASEQAIGKEIDITTALSNNYISLFINQSFHQLLIDEQKRDKELVRLLEKKYAASQAAKVDLLNAEVVTQGIAQSLLENENAYDVLITQFRQLIRRPEDETIFPEVPKSVKLPEIHFSFLELVQIMERNRHALLAAKSQVDSSDALLKAAVLAPLPDFQLTAAINSWRPESAPNPGVTRDYTFGIGIAVPIFLPFNEVPGIKAAHRDHSSAENQLESQRLQSVSDLQVAFSSLQASEREVNNLIKFVIPAAKASYDLTLLTYSLGKADYFRLNEARKAWLDAERDLLNKKQNSTQLYNQLISQVGCDLTRKEGPHACK